MTSSTAIRRATTADLEDLVPLFDAYRVFYGQPADSQRARRFLADRLQSGDSVLLLAESKGAAAGFTQIYPTLFLGQYRAGMGAQRPVHRTPCTQERRGACPAVRRGGVRPHRWCPAPGTGDHARQRYRAGALPGLRLAAVQRHPALPASAWAVMRLTSPGGKRKYVAC